jgi:hypothetical protein
MSRDRVLGLPPSTPQSFDGSKIAITGKLDKYTDAIHEYTTTAQAEGAIEGTIKDVRASPPKPPPLVEIRRGSCRSEVVEACLLSHVL